MTEDDSARIYDGWQKILLFGEQVMVYFFQWWLRSPRNNTNNVAIVNNNGNLNSNNYNNTYGVRPDLPRRRSMAAAA